MSERLTLSILDACRSLSDIVFQVKAMLFWSIVACGGRMPDQYVSDRARAHEKDYWERVGLVRSCHLSPRWLVSGGAFHEFLSIQAAALSGRTASVGRASRTLGCANRLPDSVETVDADATSNLSKRQLHTLRVA
jgi:hypothetical protein